VKQNKTKTYELVAAVTMITEELLKHNTYDKAGSVAYRVQLGCYHTDTDTLYSVDSYYSPEAFREMKNLRIESWLEWNSLSEFNASNGKVYWHGPGEMNVNDLFVAHKIMADIARKRERFEVMPRSFGQFVSLTLKAMGVNRFTILEKRDWVSYYGTSSVNFNDRRMIEEFLDNEIKTAQEFAEKILREREQESVA
jgi:hypothetical protein